MAIYFKIVECILPVLLKLFIRTHVEVEKGIDVHVGFLAKRLLVNVIVSAHVFFFFGRPIIISEDGRFCD